MFTSASCRVGLSCRATRALSAPRVGALLMGARCATYGATARPTKNAFRAGNTGGSGGDGEANPFKSGDHVSHKWMLLACASCLAAGYLAGYVVEVDETLLKPHFRKDDVIRDATKQFEFRPDLAATSIRVAFVLAARRAGFPASTVDESCGVVAGLGDVAGVLNYLATTHGATTEDAASLAAVAAVKYLRGPYEAVLRDWRWGRNDTDVAPGRNRPADPSKTLFSVPTVLKGLGDLSDAECVAVMACHGVGEFHENVSGVDGATHIGRRYTLSNEYYRFLLDHEKQFKPYAVERTEDNKDVKELPRTMLCTYAAPRKGSRQQRLCVWNKGEVEAMLHKPKWRPIVEEFAKDRDAWARNFESGFTKLIDSNFRRLRVYSDPE